MAPLIFAPSQHKPRCKRSTGKGYGQRWSGVRRFAALTGREKNLLQTVDETLNALHNLVSLLQRMTKRQRRSATTAKPVVEVL